jgi:hypothetical protein
MDEELRQLEAELKDLLPARPQAGLRTRVQAELEPAKLAAAVPATQPIGRRRTRWWWQAALPIAAAVVLGFALRSRGPVAGETARRPIPAVVSGPAQEAFKPVAARNVLYAADDEGTVTLDDGTPAHRERLHFVDTITWRNSRTNASLTWSVPREEVRIVPVRFQ